MSRAYLLDANNVTKSLQRVRCKDEAKELQHLLEKNPHLLPSEQIYPDEPPQWLLVRREMPVIDPGSGAERWSIDFLFVDHMAIPTLVECKRCNDTRSRREVIAQMLEYAANGHHYWAAEELQAQAQDSAGGLEALTAWITRSYAGGGVGDFFEAVVANLRKATMRLVFFLEESPYELRSLVEFLNDQLKETEVLLVEARLYDSPSGRFVVPWLLGYTEQARIAKRESRAQVVRQAGAKGEEAFLAAIAQPTLSQEVRSAIESFLQSWSTADQQVPHWSFGVNAIMVAPMLPKRGLFQIGRNGDLSLYFGYWNPDVYPDVGPTQVVLRDHLATTITEVLGVTFTDKQLRGFPTIKAAVWVPRAPDLLAAVRKLLDAA